MDEQLLLLPIATMAVVLVATNSANFPPGASGLLALFVGVGVVFYILTQ